MKQRIIITKEADRVRALYIIGEAPLSPTIEVMIKDYEETRSAAQQRLMWLWNTEIANGLGNTKEEQHYQFKERFAVPIFIRDDEAYAEMVLSVKAIRRQGMNTEADALKKYIVENTSTTDFKVKQMSEYLHEIEMEAATVGVEISFPEDLMQKSLGRRG